MREFCFCGQVGELEGRAPVLDGDGYQALQCPKCGHLDRLEWLPEDAGGWSWSGTTVRQAS